MTEIGKTMEEEIQTMTSRERVRAVLNHEIPDKMPIDFCAHRSSGIGAHGYNNLKRHLGYSEETTKVYDLMQQLAVPEDFLIERFGGDILQVMLLKPSFGIREDKWKKVTLPSGDVSLVPEDFNPVINQDGDYEILDETGKCVAKRPKEGIYYDNVDFFLEGVESIEELNEKMRLPEITEEELDFIENQAKYLYENTDKALLCHVGCAVFEAGQQQFGYEDFYYNLAAEPELLHYWAEKLTDAYLVILDKMLGRIGKYIDVALFGGDDLGTQISLQLSPDMYREMIKPYQKKLYQFVHRNYPEVKVGLHSCGAIKDIIPDLIDAGVDVLNPVQISAAGMEPEELKEKFGKDIVFWGGGADMQGYVNKCESPEDVYHHVYRLLEIFAPGGNYIFAPVHNILDNISPEKIIAIYQAAKDYREQNPYT